ncbi:hypothetical protein [Streptomyces viridochromogenes]|uniref:hypothetical protein n=1 Tax=Streptomyces viridochromogenes TaxID=1938 RepID=UPI000AA60A8A|nr:hypothetical protein [Streptomyces viridochromogenes]
MSDDKKTTQVTAPGTDATEVTTLNTHATGEPLNTSTLAAEKDTGGATTDNTHATDEPA